MGAAVLNGIEGAVYVEDSHFIPAHGIAAAGARRNLAGAGDANEGRCGIGFGHMGELMVRDYRAWLQSEMQLLAQNGEANAVGQGEMARRAMERLDLELGDRVVLELEPDQVDAIAAELDALAQAEALPDALVELLQIIRTTP